MTMTLLIPLLLRLTSLFERGSHVEEPTPEDRASDDDLHTTILDKERNHDW